MRGAFHGLSLSLALAASLGLAAAGPRVPDPSPPTRDEPTDHRTDEGRVCAPAPECRAPVPPLGACQPMASRGSLQATAERLAHRHGLDMDLVQAIIWAESGYDPWAVSPAGAIGLMQVMPATAGDYGVTSVCDLFEPKTNLDTGMRHLRRLLDKYSGNKARAVMAYNAGEGALERSGGFVRYPETQRYLHQVLTAYLRSKGVRPDAAEVPALVGMALNSSPTGSVGTSSRWRTGVGVPELAVRPPEPTERLSRIQPRAAPLSSRLQVSTKLDQPSLHRPMPSYRTGPDLSRMPRRPLNAIR